MPVALPVDWTLAKELYISGLPLARVSERMHVKLDTLCARASRERWKLDLGPKAATETIAVQQTAQRLANQTLTVAERVLCKVERMALDSPGDAKNVASAVSSAYSVARKALGLDDHHGPHGKNWGGGVSIDVHLAPGSSMTLNENKVIDVTPKQLPE